MENEDEDQYWPASGYHAMLDYLTIKSKQHNAIIRTGEPVKKILHDTDVRVITSLKKYHCKKVIIAVPVSMLQVNKKHLGFIEFPSSLKSYIKAAKQIGNGNVIKFLIEFDTAFWLDKKFLQYKKITPPSYLFTDAAIPTWWTQYPSPKPLLTGWLGGPPALPLKRYSQNKLRQLAVVSLASVFSFTPDEINKRIKKFVAKDWINEPYISGAYSYATIHTAAARSLLQQPFENAFYFAGEYVIHDSTATVDAALKSAIAAASQVLQSL